MAPKKYYAVARGRKPGIYRNWPDAQAQVSGFNGALYRGFPTLAEAEEWLKNPGRPARRDAVTKSGKSNDMKLAGEGVTIYTDGGSINNPGPGGFGIVQIYGDQRREMSGGFRLTTNNRMELYAVIFALRHLEHRDVPVTIFTDSSYVVNGINKGWAESWRKRGWIKSDKKPAVNPDLWSELLDLISPLDITFVWVRGHSGNPLNERCDELAVSSARKKNLPPDKGYEGI